MCPAYSLARAALQGGGSGSGCDVWASACQAGDWRAVPASLALLGRASCWSSFFYQEYRLHVFLATFLPEDSRAIFQSAGAGVAVPVSSSRLGQRREVLGEGDGLPRAPGVLLARARVCSPGRSGMMARSKMVLNRNIPFWEWIADAVCAGQCVPAHADPAFNAGRQLGGCPELCELITGGQGSVPPRRGDSGQVTLPCHVLPRPLAARDVSMSQPGW